jgi:GTPase SAR1 family protein
MAGVLVTGMSGAGKTSLLNELRRRGHLTVDDDGWERPDRPWDETPMTRLLESHRDIVVSGTVANQGRFEHVALLSAALDALLARVAARTTNPNGSTPEQRPEIAHYAATVEPLLRRGATLELDGRQSAAELADIVEQLPRHAVRP